MAAAAVAVAVVVVAVAAAAATEQNGSGMVHFRNDGIFMECMSAPLAKPHAKH